MANNAERDATNDMLAEGDEPIACKHPAPWNSEGPLRDRKGSYTRHWCDECGQEMRKTYYR